ncbi:unnamed protein product, partial [Ranitomeya imitator]
MSVCPYVSVAHQCPPPPPIPRCSENTHPAPSLALLPALAAPSTVCSHVGPLIYSNEYAAPPLWEVDPHIHDCNRRHHVTADTVEDAARAGSSASEGAGKRCCREDMNRGFSTSGGDSAYCSAVSCTAHGLHMDNVRVRYVFYTDPLTLMGPCNRCAPTKTDMSPCLAHGDTARKKINDICTDALILMCLRVSVSPSEGGDDVSAERGGAKRGRVTPNTAVSSAGDQERHSRGPLQPGERYIQSIYRVRELMSPSVFSLHPLSLTDSCILYKEELSIMLGGRRLGVKTQKGLKNRSDMDCQRSVGVSAPASGWEGGRMVCEFFLLSSIWFVVVIFWMETISMWLFLCHLFQDRAMYQWGDRIYVTHPDQIMYIIIRWIYIVGPYRSSE